MSVTANTRADGEEFLAIASRIGIRVATAPYGFDEVDRALLDLAAGAGSLPTRCTSGRARLLSAQLREHLLDASEVVALLGGFLGVRDAVGETGQRPA